MPGMCYWKLLQSHSQSYKTIHTCSMQGKQPEICLVDCISNIPSNCFTWRWKKNIFIVYYGPVNIYMYKLSICSAGICRSYIFNLYLLMKWNDCRSETFGEIHSWTVDSMLFPFSKIVNKWEQKNGTETKLRFIHLKNHLIYWTNDLHTSISKI